MKISEIFRSLQGEGLHIGQPSIFVRTYGCNMAEECPLDCDTKYSWQGNDYTEMDVNEVRNKIFSKAKTKNELLTITGGEPILWEDELHQIPLPHGEPYSNIIVETNGTIVPKYDWADFWSVSPKTPINYQEWKKFDGVYFKFVCSGQEDFDRVNDIVASENLDLDRVWLMTEGATKDDLRDNRKLVVEEALERGYNFSSRLQVDLWGNKRGT